MMQRNNRVMQITLERLEPYAGKLACTVLRRVAAGNGCCLSGIYQRIQQEKQKTAEQSEQTQETQQEAQEDSGETSD